MSMVSKKDIVRHMTDVLNFKNVIIYQDGWDDSVGNCVFWIKKLFFRLKTIAVKLKKSSQYLKNCKSMFSLLGFHFSSELPQKQERSREVDCKIL